MQPVRRALKQPKTLGATLPKRLRKRNTKIGTLLRDRDGGSSCAVNNLMPSTTPVRQNHEMLYYGCVIPNGQPSTTRTLPFTKYELIFTLCVPAEATPQLHPRMNISIPNRKMISDDNTVSTMRGNYSSRHVIAKTQFNPSRHARGPQPR